MNRPSVVRTLVGLCVGLVALTCACEKIQPSGPFEEIVTPVTMIEIPKADITGYVQDQEGSPLDGVRISLGVAEQARTVFTGADGSYHIPGLDAGGYKLTGSKEGYLPAKECVVLAGEYVTRDMVLTAYAAAPGRRVEAVECTDTGELRWDVTVSSEVTEGLPSVEMELTEGTVLRDALRKLATGELEVAAVALSGAQLLPPEVGTFGITEPPVYVAGDPTPTMVDLDLGGGHVAKNFEIVEPNPLLREGGSASGVTPAASVILEPEGLTFENPDGSPSPQRVVLGNLPFANPLPAGRTLELVSPDGEVITGTVLSDGFSLEAQVSELGRYDLLVSLDIETLENDLSAGYVQEAAKVAKAAANVTLDDVLYIFPHIDDPVVAASLASFIATIIEVTPGTPGRIEQEEGYVIVRSTIRLTVSAESLGIENTPVQIVRGSHFMKIAEAHEQGVVF